MIAKTGKRLGPVAWTIVLILVTPIPKPIRAEPANPEPLRVKVEIARGPYLVGQGIELTAGVVGDADRPRVDVPKVAGAEVWTIGTDVSPLTVSGIGSTVSQENLFLTRFRLVPRRPGTFEIPPVRAEANGRIGKSRASTIAVQSPPIEGRPATFLGGVGSLSVRAEAEPPTLRVGQVLDYRIRLDGTAAWGSTARPDLGRFERLPVALRIEPTRDDAVPEPPSRTFTYRLRPTRPGDVVLPPVLVSWFDPKLGRYATKATSGVPIRVVAVPGFDPKSVDYHPPEARRLSRLERGSLVAGGLILLCAVLAAGWWLVRRRLRSRSTGANSGAARRFAARTARELGEGTADPGEIARQITEALIRYLELGLGRPPGALTPAEAWSGVVDLTGSAELGERAKQLLAACDRTLYGIAVETAPDRDEAGQLFRDLGR